MISITVCAIQCICEQSGQCCSLWGLIVVAQAFSLPHYQNYFSDLPKGGLTHSVTNAARQMWLCGPCCRPDIVVQPLLAITTTDMLTGVCGGSHVPANRINHMVSKMTISAHTTYQTNPI